MNRKKLFDFLAITIVVATIGSVAAFGGRFFGIDPESGMSGICTQQVL